MDSTAEIKETWDQTKAKLKQKFAILTDNDMLFTEGKSEEMLARLQLKTGKTKAEIQKIISNV